MKTQKIVLITGGSGLIGSALSKVLLANGFRVRWLTRRVRTNNAAIEQYLWNPDNGSIDKNALLGVDTIIHLAGSNIAEKRWTTDRKQDIITSRCKPMEVLERCVKDLSVKPHCIISASAIGIYPGHDFEAKLDENATLGTSFTAEVCKQWERMLIPFTQLGIRTASIRIGVVLSAEGGALPQLVQLSNARIASPLGNGKQSFAWIHIDDLCSVFKFVMETADLSGAINAVAPQSTSNAEFMATLAQAVHKRQLMPAVPAFVVRILFGERAQMLLEGSNIVPQKLINHHFTFAHAQLKSALDEIIRQG